MRPSGVNHPTETTTELLKVLPELAIALHSAAPHAQVRPDPQVGRLTPRQMAALVHLATYGRQTMSELASGLGIGRAAASEMVERLVERGIAERASDPHDRRVVYVRLASEARPFVERVVDGLQTDVEATIAQFPSLDGATLVAFLATLTERLKRAST